MNKRIFSYSLPFPKVSAKDIYYCGEKPGESDIAHMKSNYHMPLKQKKIEIINNFVYF